MQQAAGREFVAEALDQFAGQLRFFGPSGGRVPLFAFHVVDGNEGGLAAHGQADIACFQIRIDVVAERVESAATARRCRAW